MKLGEQLLATLASELYRIEYETGERPASVAVTPRCYRELVATVGAPTGFGKLKVLGTVIEVREDDDEG